MSTMTLSRSNDSCSYSSNNSSTSVRSEGDRALYIPSASSSSASTPNDSTHFQAIPMAKASSADPLIGSIASSSSAHTARPSADHRSMSQRLQTASSSRRRTRMTSESAAQQQLSVDTSPLSVHVDGQHIEPPSQAETVRRFLAKRRHSRSSSAPQAPLASSLHVDTLLPLQLPPRKLCAMSPLRAQPMSWPQASKGNDADGSTFSPASSSSISFERYDDDAETHVGASIRRSDSLASFISADTDGSWHGDAGDEDPDGQLARALNDLKKEGGKSSSLIITLSKDFDGDQQHVIHRDSVHGHGPLQLSTFDYIDEEEAAVKAERKRAEANEREKLQVQIPLAAILPDTPTVIRTLGDYQLDHLQMLKRQMQEEPAAYAKDDDAEEEQATTIMQHAGPIMACVAAVMFSLSDALADAAEAGSDDAAPPPSPFDYRTSRSYSVSSSLCELGAELQSRRRLRRRAHTVATDSDVLSHGEHQASSGLQALWQWLVPSLNEGPQDDQTPRPEDVIEDVWLPHRLSRNGSMPSLASSSSSMSSTGSQEDAPDGHVNWLQDEFLHPFQSPTDTKPARRQYRLSPLWDNELMGEPYEQPWTSLLGLSV